MHRLIPLALHRALVDALQLVFYIRVKALNSVQNREYGLHIISGMFSVISKVDRQTTVKLRNPSHLVLTLMSLKLRNPSHLVLTLMSVRVTYPLPSMSHV